MAGAQNGGIEVKTTLILLDEVVLVKVEGVVDSLSSGRLYDILVRAVRTGMSKLIIDVSAVPDMTRAGVRGMVVAAQMLRRTGGKVLFCGASPATRRLLETLGHDQLFAFDDPLPAALDALSPGVLDRTRRFAAPPPQPEAQSANSRWQISA
jgi:anti-anti-sigma factor